MSLSQLKRQLRNAHLGLPSNESLNSHEAVEVKAAEKKKGPDDWHPPTEYTNPKDLEAGMSELLESFVKPKEEVNYNTKRSMDNLHEFISTVGHMLAKFHMQV